MSAVQQEEGDRRRVYLLLPHFHDVRLRPHRGVLPRPRRGVLPLRHDHARDDDPRVLLQVLHLRSLKVLS